MKKQDKQKSEFFTKMKNFFKKTSEHEREKQALKKAIKANKPKTYFARKSGVFVFWSVLTVIIMLLVVITSTVKEIKATSNKDLLNPKLTQSASEYGEQFLKAYIPVEINEKGLFSELEAQRKEVLAYYATTDIVDDLAKVHQNTHNIKLLDLSMYDMNVTNNSYLITYKANIQYSTVPTFTEVEGVPVQNEIVTTYATKFITTKLYLLEDGSFVVYELPSFEAVEEAKKTITVSEKKELMTVYEDHVVKGLTSFVNTFMDAYLRDTKDKISFLLTKDFTLEGFNDKLKLKEIKKVELYKGASETEYLVYVTALVTDAETNVTYPTLYSLAVVYDADKDTYLVKGVNDKSYIQEAVKYKIKVEESKK